MKSTRTVGRAHVGLTQESRIRENAAGERVRAEADRVHGWGIDKLVYELYGLSDEEIGVVEGK